MVNAASACADFYHTLLHTQGSLISYFKAKQGAYFYVKLYCAFYLPGLPVSLMQQKFDVYVDDYFGSANAFMVCGKHVTIISEQCAPEVTRKAHPCIFFRLGLWAA